MSGLRGVGKYPIRAFKRFKTNHPEALGITLAVLFSTAVPLIAPELLLIGRVKAVVLRFGSSGHSPLMSPAPLTGGETPGLPTRTHLFVQVR